VCNAVWEKTEPTLGQVRSAVRESFKTHAKEFKALSPDVLAGYCGSVATGKVGNKDKSHYGLEPDIRGECGRNYDVDGFMISSFANKMPDKGKGKRWGKFHDATLKIEANMRATLAGKPALAYLEGGEKSFSLVVYSPKERSEPFKKGGIILIF